MGGEIHHKISTVRIIQKEFSSVKVFLQNELNLTDFPYVSNLFFGIDDKILKSKSLVLQKGYYKFLHVSKADSDPENVIFNFSRY